MNDEKLDISKLLSCIESLKKCNQDLKNIQDKNLKEYIEDSCIQRFEYTFETSRKIMKKFLKLQYGISDKELTMNNVFRLMEGYGFILSWLNWRKYCDKRNETSYEYNKKKAKEILNYVDDLIKDSEYLYNKLNFGNYNNRTGEKVKTGKNERITIPIRHQKTGRNSSS